MSGIIIYIPPIIPTPPINATSTIMPVKSGSTFVDSNIKNVVDEYLKTIISGNTIGLDLDFVNNKFCLGNPTGVNFCANDGTGVIEISGVTLSEPLVVAEKLMYTEINSSQYYIQLYKLAPPII
jgi:hypothetical protein